MDGVISIDRSTDLSQSFPLFPAGMDESWDTDNYGSLVIPYSGMNIQINLQTLDLYGKLIEKYENNKQVKIQDGKLQIDGKGVNKYTFRQDYYFMMGDNRDNSLDSRFWGFVPDGHIVGKPLMVLFSKNEQGKGLERIRWNRIFSSID